MQQQLQLHARALGLALRSQPFSQAVRSSTAPISLGSCSALGPTALRGLLGIQLSGRMLGAAEVISLVWWGKHWAATQVSLPERCSRVVRDWEAVLLCFLLGQLCLASARAAEKHKLLFFLHWKFSHQETFSQHLSSGRASPSSKSPCCSVVTRRARHHLPGRSPRASLPCLPLLGKPQSPEVLLCIVVVLALLQPFPCFSPRC